MSKNICLIVILLPSVCLAEEVALDNSEKTPIESADITTANQPSINNENVSVIDESQDIQAKTSDLGQIKPLTKAMQKRLKNPEDQLEERRELLEELEEYQKVTIAESFIELHTNAGRGFPVFHIEEKGEAIYVIKKKTQWYKVLTKKGHRGWVHEDKIARTLLATQEKFDIANSKQSDFQKKVWEAGVLTGDFGGATTLSLYGGWNWTENIATELSVSQALGSVSDIRYASINLIHQVFPEWRVSPYFKMGAGIIKTEPFSTIIQSEDRSDEMVLVGFGLKMYASRQFFIRAEYLNHTILTSRNDNDEIEEWKIGISVFF